MLVVLACGTRFEDFEEFFEKVSPRSKEGFDFGGFIYCAHGVETHIYKPLITHISYREVPSKEVKNSKTSKKKDNGKTSGTEAVKQAC